jgi:hypothetical protein
MISYEALISLPVIGGVAGILYKKLNGKIDRGECLRVHESLDKRLGDIHEDLKFIKEKVSK